MQKEQEEGNSVGPPFTGISKGNEKTREGKEFRIG